MNETLHELTKWTMLDTGLDKVVSSDELRCNDVKTKLVVTPA